jgi:hypothetical protein
MVLARHANGLARRANRAVGYSFDRSCTEDAALRRLTQAGVVTTSMALLAGQLAGDFRQPIVAQAIGILYEMASG